MARRTHIRLPLGRYVPPVGNEFVSVEALSAFGLLAAAVAALIWANLPGESYADFWGYELTIGVGSTSLTHSLREWVTDGIVTVFFFVVGLEIKREIVHGELRDPRTATLPVIAALGGMVVPALIFLALNPAAPERSGWGIPMATDLAFVLGVLALLGPRVPSTLKLFLLTLAVVDDVGSILVIALFYSGGLAWPWVLAADAVVLALILMRRLAVRHPVAYVIPALALWVCLSEAGLHGALAGVVLGMLTPAGEFHGRPVIDRLEHHLHPWSSFLVVPLFALANAGIALGGGVFVDALHSRVGLGVFAARVIGKTLGIFLAAEIAVRTGLGRLPTELRRVHLLAGGTLAAMGFTVALVVADLSYGDGPLVGPAKVGLFAAALSGAALGSAVLLVSSRRVTRSPHEGSETA
jgi:NhaA family Na+:H+ antiporter